MIIKRKLYSQVYTETEQEEWKKPIPSGYRVALSSLLGGMGILIGAGLGSLTNSGMAMKYGAALGGILGAGFGMRITSNKAREEQAKALKGKSNQEKERIYQELKEVWESQRPMSYEEFYKKFPGVKRDLNEIEFDWSLSYNDINYPNYSNLSQAWDKFNPNIHIPLGYCRDNNDFRHILLYDINSRVYIYVIIDGKFAMSTKISSQKLKNSRAKYAFSTFKSYNEKFLGIDVKIEEGGAPGFDIKDIKAKKSDFIKAIYEDEKYKGEENSIINPLTIQNVEKRVIPSDVFWDEMKHLRIIFFDKESDFFWDFNLISPDDNIEVNFSGD